MVFQKGIMYDGKKIGIWGLGVVGRSLIRHFSSLSRGEIQLELLDAKTPNNADAALLQENNIPFFAQSTDLIPFLERNDYIIPSPGIDLRPYKAYEHKWISELDLFAHAYQKRTIAITGSVGKTSSTHILGQLLNNHGLITAVGGNIGTAMLDLINQESDCALLEVSSFQLELCKTWAPDLALWTNFYPNHLDRHTNEQGYFDAKYQILAHQKPNQRALLPLTIASTILERKPQGSLAFFCAQPPTEHELTALHNYPLYYIDKGMIVVRTATGITPVIATEQLPAISYQENWLLMVAALHLLAIPMTVIEQSTATLALPEHRLEKLLSINDVDFYNDSKSTTPEATLAAVQQLCSRPLHLFLGGISKGIDRSELIQKLQGKLYHVYCFGKEAALLHELCTTYHLASSSYATLDTAVQACTKNMRPGDTVLLSPSGASFDLFENYIHRGNYFKQLVAIFFGE
jgi:UDP-N-acetylmuramoylalanine--D-glutamate ligase